MFEMKWQKYSRRENKLIHNLPQKLISHSAIANINTFFLHIKKQITYSSKAQMFFRKGYFREIFFIWHLSLPCDFFIIIIISLLLEHP